MNARFVLPALSLVAAVAGAYAFHLYWTGGFEGMSGPNSFEKATIVGTSTKADLDDFKDKGGLVEGNNSWHGFYVKQYKLALDKADKVGIVIVQLEKSWPGKKLASMENVRNALTKDCGTNWTRSALGNGTSATSSTGLTCMIMDGQSGTVEVTMGRDETRQASVPPSQPAPAPRLASAPPPAQASVQPLTEFDKQVAQQRADTAAELSEKPVRVGKTLKYVDGQTYILTGVIVKRATPTDFDMLKLDQPFVVDNKIVVNGTPMGDSQDGKTIGEMEIDGRMPGPPAGTKGEFLVEIGCSEANCAATSVVEHR